MRSTVFWMGMDHGVCRRVFVCVSRLINADRRYNESSAEKTEGGMPYLSLPYPDSELER